jgi:hypothetical protein
LTDNNKNVGSRKSLAERRRRLRDSLFSDISEDDLWLRSKRLGFTTIPRTMPIIGRILDGLAGKGQPLHQTYLALWCHVFDEAFVEIRSPKELAFESGFSGARGDVTWRARMKILEELNFIRAKPGLIGQFQYIIILNPIKVIAQHYVDRSHDIAYVSLLSRLAQVGADDLDV